MVSAAPRAEEAQPDRAHLAELAPEKVFDPRAIYEKHKREEAYRTAAQNGGKEEEEEKNGSGKKKGKKDKKGKKKGGGKKMSKADQIRAAANARREKKTAKRDEERLATLGHKKLASSGGIKLQTESGKLRLLFSVLKESVKAKNVVDTLDALWEIEDVTKTVDKATAEGLLEKYAKYIKKAKKMREDPDRDLVDFQLTAMGDRLPPLNTRTIKGDFKLDAWQLKVIKLVEAKKVSPDHRAHIERKDGRQLVRVHQRHPGALCAAD